MPSRAGLVVWVYEFAALIVGPDASGMVRRPMPEKALAALGVLPARGDGG